MTTVPYYDRDGKLHCFSAEEIIEWKRKEAFFAGVILSFQEDEQTDSEPSDEWMVHMGKVYEQWKRGERLSKEG